MPCVKYNIIIVVENVIMTRLMQNADVFEKFKVIADTMSLDADGARKTEDVIAKVRKQFDIDKRQYRLIAIFRPQYTDGAWRDEDTKVISDGKKFTMFDAFLKANGFVQ